MRISVAIMLLYAGCGDDTTPQPPMPDMAMSPPDLALSVAPLRVDSPWPKFRGNLEQSGRGPLPSGPSPAGAQPWELPTGKGIFSAPVLGPDDTVYVGSADRYFYAVDAQGNLKWKLLTGGVIDSAALLDDSGRLYVGAGDSILRALDPTNGGLVWMSAADPPSMQNGAFISWFEGNVAIGADGQLIAPNDSNTVYGIDRASGTIKWRFPDGNQNWSLPAIDRASGMFCMGNNNLLSLQGDNIFCLKPDGTKVWGTGVQGNVAASPMITPDGKLLVGGFDGILHAYDLAGHPLWTFPTRDHLYASPSLMPDGTTVIQPSADGTIYAVALSDGHQLWTYDTREAIRSSASIAADGLIYVGGGDGRMYVLGRDGKLRWSMILETQDRHNLNSSAALGKLGFYIAGEDGKIFGVPYDWCMGGGGSDQRCTPPAPLADGASVLMNTPFGRVIDDAPASTDPNAAFAFSLFVRQGGQTQRVFLDPTLSVTASPSVPLTVTTSGDRRFFTVEPQTPFVADSTGATTLTLQGSYSGAMSGTFARTLRIPLTAAPASAPTLLFPSGGSPTTAIEALRLALPQPTILPSYNQIGFDFLHYLITLVEGDPTHVVGWLSGVMLASDQNTTVIDPATQTLIPLEGTYANGLLTLTNDQGFAISIDNDEIVVKRLRLGVRLDGSAQQTMSVHGTAICADVPVYGPFLEQLGFCNPQTDVLEIIGAVNTRAFGAGTIAAPSGVGTVTYAATMTSLTATVTGSSLRLADHTFTVLLVDSTTGHPVSLQYGTVTTRTADGTGKIATVAISYSRSQVPSAVRAYLMVDGYPTSMQSVTIP
jgi:outer membrane protein assembly factor BamB